MGEVVTDVSDLTVVTSNFLDSFPPVCGALLSFSKTLLAFDLACKCLLQTLLLIGSIVKSVPIRRSDRCYNVSVEPISHFHQLLFCKMLQIGEQLTLSSNNHIVLR